MRSLGVLSLLFLVAACHDAGQDTLAKVKTQYGALVQAGTPPRSRDWDALLRELESIPKSSRARPEAEQLVRAITTARQGAVERPLAVAGRADIAAELNAARAECEQLAKDLAGLEGDARKAKLDVLSACRRRADAISNALAHGAHEDGGA